MGQIFTVLGGTAAIGIAIAVFVRMLVTHWLSKDIERHKTKLDKENQLAFERLRADNARQAVEHETRFRRVDEKVAERLDETYRILLKLYKSVSKLVAVLEFSGGPTKDELWKQCEAANAEFNDYFFPNRCYVPPAIYKHIKSLYDTLINIAGEFWSGLQHHRQHGAAFDKDYWWSAFQAADKEATPLFRTMVQVVQLRLGVEDTDAELKLLNALPPIKIKTGENK